MNMKTKYQTFKLLSILQVCGEPYSALYVNEDSGKLYVSAQLEESEDITNEYVAVETNPQEIKEYLNGKMKFTDIFGEKEKIKMIFQNNKISIYPDFQYTPDEDMESFDKFDPDLCPSKFIVLSSLDNYSKKFNNYPFKLKRSNQRTLPTFPVPVERLVNNRRPKGNEIYDYQVSIAKEPKEEYRKTK